MTSPGITNAEWVERRTRSRQALAAWTLEARLPWADRQMTCAIAETEIAFLKGLRRRMPEISYAELDGLIHDWDEVRLRFSGDDPRRGGAQSDARS